MCDSVGLCKLVWLTSCAIAADLPSAQRTGCSYISCSAALAPQCRAKTAPVLWREDRMLFRWSVRCCFALVLRDRRRPPPDKSQAYETGELPAAASHFCHAAQCPTQSPLNSDGFWTVPASVPLKFLRVCHGSPSTIFNNISRYIIGDRLRGTVTNPKEFNGYRSGNRAKPIGI